MQELGLSPQVPLYRSYRPELNPDEQVWNRAKRRIGRMSI